MTVIISLWYLYMPVTKPLKLISGKRRSYWPPTTTRFFGADCMAAPARSCTPAVEPGAMGQQAGFMRARAPLAALRVLAALARCRTAGVLPAPGLVALPAHDAGADVGARADDYADGFDRAVLRMCGARPQ
mgnify:CR=1 FL=1